MFRQLTRLLLGTFIVVELIYLPFANVLQRVPRRPDPLPKEILGRHQREGRAFENDSAQVAVDRSGKGVDRWAELTAQGQGWSLFAPRFGAAGTFLTLEATDTRGQRIELRSLFEPADTAHYVRYDVTHYRQFYREMSYALVYSHWTPESFATRGDEWRLAIDEHVIAFRRSLIAYMKWRLADAFPGTTFERIDTNVRVHLNGVVETVPLARWDSPRSDVLMPYNPTTRSYRD